MINTESTAFLAPSGTQDSKKWIVVDRPPRPSCPSPSSLLLSGPIVTQELRWKQTSQQTMKRLQLSDDDGEPTTQSIIKSSSTVWVAAAR